MKSLYIFIVMFALSGFTIFSSPASAEKIKCGDCTKRYPCATMFEFKNLKFTHNVYCEKKNGKEVWNSKDEEKFDMFYFHTPKATDPKKELDI